jgi:hypothetical protein
MTVPVYTHADMRKTIFQDARTRRVMEQHGIEFTADVRHAKLLVGNHERMLREMIGRFRRTKRYLLWTHEPRAATYDQRFTVMAGYRVRTMTAHSGDIYQSNYYYASIRSGKPRAAPARTSSTINRRIVCIATRKSARNEQVRLGRGFDLTALRAHIALAGHRIGKVDIYGEGWPAGVTLGESRRGAWAVAKYKILARYAFNLCFENTLLHYYCSEKLWQAIYCGCLPIYFGHDSIYEDFPRDSFVDYALLGTPNRLFELVDTMSPLEFANRYNKCLQVFTRARRLGAQARRDAAAHAARQMRLLLAR